MFGQLTGEGGYLDGDGDGGDVCFFYSGEFIGVFFPFWGWENLL